MKIKQAKECLQIYQHPGLRTSWLSSDLGGVAIGF